MTKQYVLDLSKLDNRKAHRIFTWLEDYMGESNNMMNKCTRYAYLGISGIGYDLSYSDRLHDNQKEIDIYTFIAYYITAYKKQKKAEIELMEDLCAEIVKVEMSDD